MNRLVACAVVSALGLTWATAGLRADVALPREERPAGTVPLAIEVNPKVQVAELVIPQNLLEQVKKQAPEGQSSLQRIQTIAAGLAISLGVVSLAWIGRRRKRVVTACVLVAGMVLSGAVVHANRPPVSPDDSPFLPRDEELVRIRIVPDGKTVRMIVPRKTWTKANASLKAASPSQNRSEKLPTSPLIDEP
jgi:hypothetical protein